MSTTTRRKFARHLKHAEVVRLRAALKTIAEADNPNNPRRWTIVGLVTVARVALAGDPAGKE